MNAKVLLLQFGTMGEEMIISIPTRCLSWWTCPSVYPNH